MASHQSELTALILLSASDQPGVEESLRSVLRPFTLEVREVQKIALRGRLILGVLIVCDAAHVQAIEADLIAFGADSGFDLAIDYSQESAD